MFLRFGRLKWPVHKVLIVGVNATSVELAEQVQLRNKWGWRVVGLIDPSVESAARRSRGRRLPRVGLRRRHRAHRLRDPRQSRHRGDPVALRELVESLVLADEVDVRVDVVPELYEIFIGTVDAIVGDVPLMEITRSTVPRYYEAAKRAIDIVGALLAADHHEPGAAPGRSRDRRDRRVARALRAGARRQEPEAVLGLQVPHDGARTPRSSTGPVLADDDDPRITRVGRFLRRHGSTSCRSSSTSWPVT